MNIPGDLRYSKDHEWGKIEDGRIRIGITDYAQKELGDIVFVEVKAVGTKLKSGDTIGTIESVKAVSDIYTPVSGEIVEINISLPDTPELINQDCYGEAWMAVILMDEPSQTGTLMDAAAYGEYVRSEAK
jgi:glycine cleavage system H protein